MFTPSKGFWNPKNFGLWNPKCGLVESGILGFGIGNSAQGIGACGIPLAIGIRNPCFSNKDWNPIPGIRISPRRGIQNPRLCWILLHETIVWKGLPTPFWRALLKKPIHWFRGRKVEFPFRKIHLQKYTDSRGQGLTRGDSNAN